MTDKTHRQLLWFVHPSAVTVRLIFRFDFIEKNEERENADIHKFIWPIVIPIGFINRLCYSNVINVNVLRSNLCRACTRASNNDETNSELFHS